MQPDLPPPVLHEVEYREVLYLAVSSFLGGLAAFSSLLGDKDKKITFRTGMAYVTSGMLTSAGLVMLLSAHFGFSYPLLAVGVFAAFKAVDTIAVIGVAIQNLVMRLLGGTPKKGDDTK